ncbi:MULTISPECIES: hypothetical protein [Rhodanobacter]|uniref:Uncharacterized protein n=1 Tax=Rhodanobacter hydrolyticus TaxID=2250595 RepID=A0ABW8J3J4_9GAMM|nr:hypothetical protein [Rhodanobacter sp. 7MK24]MBD8879536.1 hypothetical protein [Rhodanobacter sp. 7MK24]
MRYRFLLLSLVFMELLSVSGRIFAQTRVPDSSNLGEAAMLVAEDEAMKDAAMTRCGQIYPSRSNQFQSAYAIWRKNNAAALEASSKEVAVLRHSPALANRITLRLNDRRQAISSGIEAKPEVCDGLANLLSTGGERFDRLMPKAYAVLLASISK